MTEVGKVQQVPIAAIEVVDRLRPVDPAHVRAIAESIGAIGQRQPIEVLALEEGGFRLISGAHRLEAMKSRGEVHIEARVVVTDPDTARLREIDENLARHDLNPLDRAASYFERKVYYERLHPEARHGGATKQVIENKKDAKIASFQSVLSFAAAAAQATGAAERSIQRAVQIYERLDPAVRAQIAGSWLARHEGELFRLSALPPTEQAKASRMLLAADVDRPKKVADAVAYLRGRPAVAPRPADKAAATLADRLGRLPHRTLYAVFDLLRPRIEEWLAARENEGDA